jgi:hypothetical protein
MDLHDLVVDSVARSFIMELSLPHIPHLSLTDLSRSAPTLRAAVSAHGLAILTRRNKPELMVVDINTFVQLLVVADQAASLVRQPNLVQLGKTLAAFEEAQILADRQWIGESLEGLSIAVGHRGDT